MAGLTILGLVILTVVQASLAARYLKEDVALLDPSVRAWAVARAPTSLLTSMLLPGLIAGALVTVLYLGDLPLVTSESARVAIAFLWFTLMAGSAHVLFLLWAPIDDRRLVISAILASVVIGTMFAVGTLIIHAASAGIAQSEGWMQMRDLTVQGICGFLILYLLITGWCAIWLRPARRRGDPMQVIRLLLANPVRLSSPLRVLIYSSLLTLTCVGFEAIKGVLMKATSAPPWIWPLYLALECLVLARIFVELVGALSDQAPIPNWRLSRLARLVPRVSLSLSLISFALLACSWAVMYYGEVHKIPENLILIWLALVPGFVALIGVLPKWEQIPGLAKFFQTGIVTTSLYGTFGLLQGDPGLVIGDFIIASLTLALGTAFYRRTNQAYRAQTEDLLQKITNKEELMFARIILGLSGAYVPIKSIESTVRSSERLSEVEIHHWDRSVRRMIELGLFESREDADGEAEVQVTGAGLALVDKVQEELLTNNHGKVNVVVK